MSLPVVAEKDGRVSGSDRSSPLPFPRTDRLTSRGQFLTVYDRGRRVRGGCVTVFGLPNPLGRCRVGLTVTRKLGNAVARNRIKRILREIYRTNRFSNCGSLDLVVNAHPSIQDCSYAEIEADLARCIRRLTPGGAS